jgi:hypothetical protein
MLREGQRRRAAARLRQRWLGRAALFGVCRRVWLGCLRCPTSRQPESGSDGVVNRSNRESKSDPLHSSREEYQDYLAHDRISCAPCTLQNPNRRQIQAAEEHRNGKTGILVVYPVGRRDSKENHAEKKMPTNE